MESQHNGVLITGGAGFVGKALIRKLLDNNIPTVALDVVGKPDSLPELSKNFKWLELSYLEVAIGKGQLSRIIDSNNVKTAIHLATTMFPSASETDLDKDLLDNMLANTRLFRSLYESGCEKIIFASSGGTVYGQSDKVFHESDGYNPNISYGVNKATTEVYLNYLAQKYDKQAVSLRISNPYGEEQNLEGNQGVIPIFLNRVSKGLPLTIVGSLKNKRDYVYIGDLTDAFIKVIEYKGQQKAFNIGSGVPTSLTELINMIEQKMSASVEKKLDGQSIDIENSVKLDVSRAKQELDWQASVSLACGIEKLIKFHKLKKK